MLNDQQLIDELRARLRQQVAGLEPAEHLLTDLERRYLRRARHARLIATAASAIVVVAVITLAVLAGGKVTGQPPAEPAPSTTFTSTQTPTPTPTATPTPTSAPQTAEQLLQRARESLVGSENMVVHARCQTRTVYGVMRLDLEGWVLESAGRSRILSYYAQDTPQGDTVSTRRPDGSTITESLDLINRTVATTENSRGPSVPLLPDISVIGDPRDLLTGVNYTTDGGMEDLNGRLAFRLSGPDGSQLQIWLDAQTYQLVRVLTSKNDIAYQWLAVNPETLALLDHEVPADFTRR